MPDKRASAAIITSIGAHSTTHTSTGTPTTATKILDFINQPSLCEGLLLYTAEAAVSYLIGGDGLSASIAAASVLAKVSRDRYVTDVLDREYPQYRFAQHKGYGTALHYAMLDQYGPCPEHRLNFLKKWRQGREQP